VFPFKKIPPEDNDKALVPDVLVENGSKAGVTPAGKPPSPGTSPKFDLTTGNITANLLRLAWPVIVSSSLNMLGPTIDVIWVGKLGSVAVAGVGVAGIAVQLLMSSMMGLVMGMRALIARAIGAGNDAEANRVVKQSLMVGVLISIFMAIIGLIFADVFLRLLGLAEDVVAVGGVYLRVIFASSIVMMIRFAMEGSLQAAGDTLRPMYITIIYRSVHIVLCPFLVFGWWIFPEMGIVGAAVTNMVAQFVGLVLITWVLLTGRTRLRLEFKNFSFDWGLIWRIVRIGIPSSVMSIQMGLGAFVLIKFLTPFGTTAVAAHTIWSRLDIFLMMPLMGLGMAAGVLAGQNLGAKKPERAVKSAWRAVILGEAVMLFWVLVIFLGAEWLVLLFNSEPALVEIGAQFLRIAAIGYLIFSLPAVLQNSISGAGDTVPPMILSVVSTWLVQIPLAYFLSQVDSFGVYGLRWAIVISVYLMALFFLIYFLRGRWKTKRV